MATSVKSMRYSRLRASAGMTYISHPIGISIEELHRDSRFMSISLRTLERWSQLDRWVERRMAFIEEWKAEARKRLTGQLAQARIEELDSLAEIATIGLQKIREDVVAPKSLEGVMRATIDALKYKDELRARIGESVIDDTGTNSGIAKELPSDVTEEAAAAAARAALVARRQPALAASYAAPIATQPAPTSLPAPVVLDINDAVGDLEDEASDLRSETSDFGERGGGEDSADRSDRDQDEG